MGVGICLESFAPGFDFYMQQPAMAGLYRYRLPASCRIGEAVLFTHSFLVCYNSNIVPIGYLSFVEAS